MRARDACRPGRFSTGRIPPASNCYVVSEEAKGDGLPWSLLVTVGTVVIKMIGMKCMLCPSPLMCFVLRARQGTSFGGGIISRFLSRVLHKSTAHHS